MRAEGTRSRSTPSRASCCGDVTCGRRGTGGGIEPGANLTFSVVERGPTRFETPPKPRSTVGADVKWQNNDDWAQFDQLTAQEGDTLPAEDVRLPRRPFAADGLEGRHRPARRTRLRRELAPSPPERGSPPGRSPRRSLTRRRGTPGSPRRGPPATPPPASAPSRTAPGSARPTRPA